MGTMSKININQIKGDWKYMVVAIKLGKGMISESWEIYLKNKLIISKVVCGTNVKFS